MGKLGDAVKAPPTPKETAFAAAFSGAQHFEDIVIKLGDRTVTAKMTLVGNAAMLDIEGDVVKAMSERGLEQGIETQGEYELERRRRALAVAVRDPADTNEPFGSAEEWGDLAMPFLADAWRQYDDMVERLDPLAVPQPEELRALIAEAISKKNEVALRSFGVRQLATYLLTTAAPPASSPSPPSSPSESSSDD